MRLTMTHFNNDLLPHLKAKEHDDYDRAIKALSSCSSPSACSAPDFTEVLKRMKHIMQAHPWWKKRIDGTPLANDLPVRAAVECCEIIRELQNASLERLPEGGC